jgi:uncharacterized protein YndB with AHSA1/START domain
VGRNHQNQVGGLVSQFRLVHDYSYPIEHVWRALTDPAMISLWTATGRGGRPVGFSTVVGARFQYVAKPTMGWNGIVNCQVLQTRAPNLLRYSWQGDENGAVTEVTYRLEPNDGGTRFFYDHTGFTGVGGYLMARLLKRVRNKMLTVGLPEVLKQMGASSNWRKPPPC